MMTANRRSNACPDIPPGAWRAVAKEADVRRVQNERTDPKGTMKSGGVWPQFSPYQMSHLNQSRRRHERQAVRHRERQGEAAGRPRIKIQSEGLAGDLHRYLYEARGPTNPTTSRPWWGVAPAPTSTLGHPMGAHVHLDEGGDWRDVTRWDAQRTSEGCRHPRQCSGSRVSCRVLIAGLRRVCTIPRGQRITMLSTLLRSPRPKCTTRLDWAR